MPSPAQPSRGVGAGWVIFGFIAMGLMVIGLAGYGVYRFLQRVSPPPRQEPTELVDYDTVYRAPGSYDSLPSPADSASRAVPPDDGTYELSAVEVQPELINRAEVEQGISRNYPPLLRDAGVTGTATIRMRVFADGTVDENSITVEQSTHEQFGEAAVRVVGRMRFRPAVLGGKPVSVWVTLPVNFQLQA
jgi:TonB family protein